MRYIRIIDANINRSAEGLRILEEIFRFIYDDISISERLKFIRHEVRELSKNLPLSQFRESATDVGKDSAAISEMKRESIADILNANLKRVEESFRVLEEFFKIDDKRMSSAFKKLRFQIYSLEQDIFSIKRRFRDIFSLNKVLYGIIDTRFSNKSHKVICSSLIEGGVKIIQLREKILDDRQLLSTASEIAKICKDNGVIFIVNDRVDIAILSDADGVHLGQSDIDILDARRILGSNKIIGVSTHNQQQVEQIVPYNPDYIGFGPIFTTNSKENPDPVVGVELLAKIKALYQDLPIVAIGGINLDNFNKVINSNPEMIAVLSGIVGKDDIAGEVKKYRSLMDDTVRVC